MSTVIVIVGLLFSSYALGMDESGGSRRFNLKLPSARISVSPAEPKIHRTEKLKFMGSASQLLLAQEESVEDLLNKIGKPKEKMNLLSPSEQFLRCKRSIDLLYPEQLMFGSKKQVKEFKVLLDNDDEHIRVKNTFELLETLLRLYRHALEELPGRKEVRAKKVRKYENKIYKDKNNYYLRFNLLQGKNLVKLAQQLFENAGRYTTPKDEKGEKEEDSYVKFKYLLLLNGALCKFRAAQKCFDEIHKLQDFGDPYNIAIKTNAQERSQPIEEKKETIKKKIRKTDEHASCVDVLSQLDKQKENARKLLKKAYAAKAELEPEEKQEEKMVFSPKKPKKSVIKKMLEGREGKADRKSESLRIIDLKIEKLRTELASSRYKDPIEREINYLEDLKKNNNHKRMATKVGEINLADHRKAVVQEFDEAEDKYLIAVDLCLRAFSLIPRQKYVNKAKKLLKKVNEIGYEKINCNPHNIIIKDLIGSYNKRIEQAESMLYNAEHCNDATNFIKKIDNDDWVWMV